MTALLDDFFQRHLSVESLYYLTYVCFSYRTLGNILLLTKHNKPIERLKAR